MLRNLLLALLGLYVLAAGVWVVGSGFTRHEQLLNVACDPTRELWRDVNKAFVESHERQTGVKIGIRQSHGGSGSQARAVMDGLPEGLLQN